MPKKKEMHKCDWEGKCKRKAFAEVYPFDVEKSREKGYPVFINKGWSYLCFRHFVYAMMRGDTVAWCEVESLTKIQNVIVRFLQKVIYVYAVIRETRFFLKLYLHAEIIKIK